MDEKLPEPYNEYRGEIQIASVDHKTYKFLDQQFGKLFPETNRSMRLQLSMEAPAWIELFFTYGFWWLILRGIWDCTGKAFFTKLFEKLGERSADDLYDGIKGLAKQVPEGKDQLESLITVWVEAQELEGRDISLRIAIPDEDNPNGAAFILRKGTPDEIEDQLVLFIGLLEGMRAALQDLRATGRKPVGSFMIAPSPKGFTIRWLDLGDNQQHDASFNFEGLPLK